MSNTKIFKLQFIPIHDNPVIEILMTITAESLEEAKEFAMKHGPPLDCNLLIREVTEEMKNLLLLHDAPNTTAH